MNQKIATALGALVGVAYCILTNKGGLLDSFARVVSFAWLAVGIHALTFARLELSRSRGSREVVMHTGLRARLYGIGIVMMAFAFLCMTSHFAGRQS